MLDDLVVSQFSAAFRVAGVEEHLQKAGQGRDVGAAATDTVREMATKDRQGIKGEREAQRETALVCALVVVCGPRTTRQRHSPLDDLLLSEAADDRHKALEALRPCTQGG